MHDPDHDEKRALRNRLPIGMIKPVDTRDPSKLSPVVESIEYEDDLHGDLSMRMAQLISILRTCLTHKKFGALSTELVADHSTDGAAHGGARNRGHWRVCRMMSRPPINCMAWSYSTSIGYMDGPSPTPMERLHPCSSKP